MPAREKAEEPVVVDPVKEEKQKLVRKVESVLSTAGELLRGMHVICGQAIMATVAVLYLIKSLCLATFLRTDPIPIRSFSFAA